MGALPQQSQKRLLGLVCLLFLNVCKYACNDRGIVVYDTGDSRENGHVQSIGLASVYPDFIFEINLIQKQNCTKVRKKILNIEHEILKFLCQFTWLLS